MPIDHEVREVIKSKGYIAIDEMMNKILADSSNAYYRNINDIGKDGDFITAPEVSQLFGEVIALWVITAWEKLQRPNNFCLVELGPGQGTMMADILRTIRDIMPELLEAANLYLYEINPYFKMKQQRKFVQYNLNIKWVDNLSQIPPLPIITLANEFFDALPVRQFMKVKKNWREVVMILDPLESHIKFNNIPLAKNLNNQLNSEHQNAPDGAILEESPESLRIMRHLSERINQHKGAALIIDYGYNIAPYARANNQYNSTLQAIKNHNYAPIIDTLGEADLTTHVDFDALQRAALEKAKLDLKYKTQRDFLLEYGIEFRVESLKKTNDASTHQLLDRQLERLISEDKMGNLFKVLEIYN